MLSDILKKGMMPQQPMMGMGQMMPQMGQQMPQLDMFGQSNNSGMLSRALRGMPWGRI